MLLNFVSGYRVSQKKEINLFGLFVYKTDSLIT